MLGILVALVVVAALAIVLTPATPPAGSCSGFGCNSSPRDWMMVYGAYIGMPILAGTVLCGAVVIAVLVRWTRLPGVAIGLLSTCGGVVAAAAVSFGYLVVR